MRRYRYTDTQPRYYPDLGLNAEPGGTYELAKAPDEHFVTVKTKPAKKAAAKRTAAPKITASTPYSAPYSERATGKADDGPDDGPDGMEPTDDEPKES